MSYGESVLASVHLRVDPVNPKTHPVLLNTVKGSLNYGVRVTSIRRAKCVKKKKKAE